MRKMLKENKGFSLVELLVAILIMAVIAGTAITLFGGVLNSSRENADKETAESIKRAVLTYMNSTNDVNLSCLKIDGTHTTEASRTPSDTLIKYLGLEITIPKTTSDNVTYRYPGTSATAAATPGSTVTKEASDFAGTFGPFLDLTKDMAPKAPSTLGWIINIDTTLQVVDVIANTESTVENVVNFVEPNS